MLSSGSLNLEWGLLGVGDNNIFTSSQSIRLTRGDRGVQCLLYNPEEALTILQLPHSPMLKIDARRVGHFTVSIICLYLFDIWTIIQFPFAGTPQLLSSY